MARTPEETRPGKMAPLARLPVFFALAGKRVVLAGGSNAAAWKAELMLAAGARLEVYAEDFFDEMQAVAADTRDAAITLINRAWMPDDLDGAALAIGAFEDEQGAAAFAKAARDTGVPVNVIDKPAFCDFSFGAIVNRSPLVLGISTDGAAPVFAQAIRAKIEALLPQVFSRWVALAAAWRRTVKASGLSFAGRRSVWQRFTARAFTNPDRVVCADEMEALIDAAKGLGAAV